MNGGKSKLRFLIGVMVFEIWSKIDLVSFHHSDTCHFLNTSPYGEHSPPLLHSSEHDVKEKKCKDT